MRRSNKYGEVFLSQKAAAGANATQLFLRVENTASDKRVNSQKTVYELYDDLDIIQCGAMQVIIQNGAGEMSYAYVHNNHLVKLVNLCFSFSFSITLRRPAWNDR